MMKRTIPIVGELRDNEEQKLTPEERVVERERQRQVREGECKRPTEDGAAFGRGRS